MRSTPSRHCCIWWDNSEPLWFLNFLEKNKSMQLRLAMSVCFVNWLWGSRIRWKLDCMRENLESWNCYCWVEWADGQAWFSELILEEYTSCLLISSHHPLGLAWSLASSSVLPGTACWTCSWLSCWPWWRQGRFWNVKTKDMIYWEGKSCNT